jgi:4,5-DOPA dioxygenase extradiol
MFDEKFPESDTTLPALFIGHGSPMNAIEDNEFAQGWANVARSFPRPKAILCISAHWQTIGTQVTAMAQPKTIHDFYGFPQALFAVNYPAPGSPELAQLIQQTVRSTSVESDQQWGLDHGAWSVLCRMFPDADIPVVQLSLNQRKPPEFHYELGKELRALRRRGVLIVGSGNIVHNLRMLRWTDEAYEWAVEFDEQIKQAILAGDHDTIINYERLGELARLAVPTDEHFLPLLYVLACQENEAVSFFAEKVTLGAISMRSLRVG